MVRGQVQGAGYLGIAGVTTLALVTDPRLGGHGWYGLFMAVPVYAIGLFLVIPVLRNQAKGHLAFGVYAWQLETCCQPARDSLAQFSASPGGGIVRQPFEMGGQSGLRDIAERVKAEI